MSPAIDDAIEPELLERITPHLGRALQENGLEEAHRGEVIALLARSPDRWPPCCGGLCDPCSMALQRAARRALSLAGAA